MLCSKLYKSIIIKKQLKSLKCQAQTADVNQVWILEGDVVLIKIINNF